MYFMLISRIAEDIISTNHYKPKYTNQLHKGKSKKYEKQILNRTFHGKLLLLEFNSLEKKERDKYGWE